MVLDHPPVCPSRPVGVLNLTRHETHSGSASAFPAGGPGLLESDAEMMRPGLESTLIALRGRPVPGEHLETANTTPIECSHACSRWTDRVTVSRVHPSISAGGLAVRSDTDASGSLVRSCRRTGAVGDWGRDLRSRLAVQMSTGVDRNGDMHPRLQLPEFIGVSDGSPKPRAVRPSNHDFMELTV